MLSPVSHIPGALNLRARRRRDGDKKMTLQDQNSVAHQTQKPGVVAAIPCFNEERFIGSVVIKARGYVDQVIVVDDGSSDRTAMIAEQAGAMVVRHDYNRGKAAAVNTAFETARKMKRGILVLLDGDGQHEPADIPRLLKPVLEGEADIVVGSRFLHVKSRIPRVRILGQHILTLLTNIGTDVQMTDSQSGFRAFSSKAIETLSFAQEGFSVESEMQFLAKEANLRMKEIPVGVEYHQTAKRSSLGHGLGVFNSVIGLISRRIPLVFFGVPGITMLAIGVIEGWRVVQGWDQTGDFYVGPALLAVLLCTLGTLSLFTGIILHAIRSYLK